MAVVPRAVVEVRKLRLVTCWGIEGFLVVHRCHTGGAARREYISSVLITDGGVLVWLRQTVQFALLLETGLVR
jgi:hypothetical protein